jgi:hypothetical protein
VLLDVFGLERSNRLRGGERELEHPLQRRQSPLLHGPLGGSAVILFGLLHVIGGDLWVELHTLFRRSRLPGRLARRLKLLIGV